MKTFNENINQESETIKEFIQSQLDIEIEKLMNDSYSVYDFIFISGSTYFPITGVVEVKTRTFESTKYSGGVLIELNKLANVMSSVTELRAKDINKIVNGYYLVKFTDVIFLFNLNEVTLGKIEMVRCQKSSSSDGSNEWVDKACFFLQEDEAVLTIKPF